ncbi:MAG: hypothetical protein WC979_09905 [Candidatus Pacearchaeota archaeon]|jgi:hypothetical protein
MKGLTARQKETLLFIEKYNSEVGCMPSVEDIGNELGTTKAGAYGHLLALEKKNMIIRNGLSRGIIINDKNYKKNITENTIINCNRIKQKKAYRIMNEAKELKITASDSCVICGSKKDLHRHHENYDKPLQIIILCQKHHQLLHKYKRNLSKNGLKLAILYNTTE